MSDDEVFGRAPPVQPVAVRPLPTLPGVNEYGQPLTPAPDPTLLSDADVFDGAKPAGPGQVSQFMGLEKGLAEPVAHARAFLDSHPVIGEFVRTLGDAFPEIGAAYDLSGRLPKIALADVAKQQAQGKVPGQAGEFAGNVADSFFVPGGPIVGGALSGALLSKSDNIGGMARDAAFGAVGGKIAHSAIGALAGLVAPKVAPAARTLMDEGIPLTAGQIKGGALQRVEDGMSSFPIVGDVVKNAKVRSIEGLNKAVANRALAPIGETVPADIAPGRDAIAYAGDKLSDRYNALIPSLTLAADPQLSADIASIGTAAKGGLTDQHTQMLGRLIKQQIVDKIDPVTGLMQGDALKDAESKFGLQIGRYSKSQDPDHQNFADALKLTRQMLRDWVQRSNPGAADELQRLNAGWANLAIGEDAASRLGAHDGLFTPGQLAGAVRGANDTVRKRGYARGSALMQDLSDAALDRLPSTVPDSGSPFRHALEAGVAGLVGKEAGMGPALGKASALGAILSAPYTRVGQPIVQNLLAGPRPGYSPALAEILERLQRPARAVGSVDAVRLFEPSPAP